MSETPQTIEEVIARNAAAGTVLEGEAALGQRMQELKNLYDPVAGPTGNMLKEGAQIINELADLHNMQRPYSPELMEELRHAGNRVYDVHKALMTNGICGPSGNSIAMGMLEANGIDIVEGRDPIFSAEDIKTAQTSLQSKYENCEAGHDNKTPLSIQQLIEQSQGRY